MDEHAVERPDATTLEVSLFGPGVGECIVLHLGNDDWFVVDSCTDSAGVPVALSYLEAIGVPASAVVGVLATHWHDDHIGGLAKLLDAATGASFYCSAAMKGEHLLQLVQLQRGAMVEGTTGLDELGSVFELLLARRQPLERLVGPRIVSADQRIYSTNLSQIWALSPSASDVAAANQSFADLIPDIKAPKRRVAFHENHASVVLQVLFQGQSVLLGADRERTADPGSGWTAIIDSGGRPDERSGHFKVPHHGSSNADEPRVWEELLDENPRSLVAPYRPSKLPREQDLERLIAKSGEVFLTAPVRGASPDRTQRTVDKLMKRMTRTRELLRSPVGQVRIRLSDSLSVVETFGAAQRFASAE